MPCSPILVDCFKKEHFNNAIHNLAQIAKGRKFDYLVWVALQNTKQNTNVIFSFTACKYRREGWFFIDLKMIFLAIYGHGYFTCCLWLVRKMKSWSER